MIPSQACTKTKPISPSQLLEYWQGIPPKIRAITKPITPEVELSTHSRFHIVSHFETPKIPRTVLKIAVCF